MKKIGEMQMKFREVREEVYYYDLNLQIGAAKRHIVLPRYHPLLGWIENFGLPPQHEWVVLAPVESFTQEAILTVDEKEINESLAFDINSEEGKHTIVMIREEVGKREIFTWKEDHTQAPRLIKNTGTFESERGTFVSTARKMLITDTWIKNVTNGQKDFIQKTIKEQGQPSAIWKKEFESEGVIPYIFYELFPITDVIDVTNARGTIIEVGYLNKEGSKVDQAHGRWYKLLILDKQAFMIEEGGYTSTTVKVGEKEISIKNTYEAALYAL